MSVRRPDALIKQLWRSYKGNPAAVATACKENLTNGPKLSNNDNMGLPNFAEQLEAVSMNKRPELWQVLDRLSDDGRSSGNLKRKLIDSSRPELCRGGDNIEKISKEG